MAITPSILTVIIITIINIITFPSATHSMSETEALLSLKTKFSHTRILDTSWISGSVPCSPDDQWDGVICNNGLVTGLHLGGMGLDGEIDVNALLELKGLRTISFAHNHFSGTIPSLNRIGFLKAIYLTGNNFSGTIPYDYFQGMGSLKKVWLADNKFTGEIPSSLTEAPQLMELHLENNEFSGGIPNLENPALVNLNVSNNKLEGQVPSSLLKFNESSFSGNSGLCSEKLGKTCEQLKENKNDDAKDVKSVSVPEKTGGSSLQIAGIAVTCALVVSLIVFFILRRWRKKAESHDVIGEDVNGGAVEVQVAAAPVKREVDASSTSSVRRGSTSRRGSTQSKGVGELMMLSDEKGVFGLTDLMRASAEVLGNGGFGSSYKAVMANGVAVVVKRTREMNVLEKGAFDAEMRKLGKLKHWNILSPLAYHYRKDEMLVISEYVPGGSLLFLLHGDRGLSHAELNWPARLKIVQGIAEGMHCLHTELASSIVPHGNLKSSNILLGPDYEPMLVDYGLSNIVSPSNAAQTLFAYKAPEAAQLGQVSPSCDVYCLGVVILEILTGKFPSQYLSNGKGGADVVEWVATAISEGRESELLDPEIASSRNLLGEMEELLHIGAACAESNPQIRLEMGEAYRRIKNIRNGGGNESTTVEVLPSPRDGYADSLVTDL